MKEQNKLESEDLSLEVDGYSALEIPSSLDLTSSSFSKIPFSPGEWITPARENEKKNSRILLNSVLVEFHPRE